jgi:hypothetical protein
MNTKGLSPQTLLEIEEGKRSIRKVELTQRVALGEDRLNRLLPAPKQWRVFVVFDFRVPAYTDDTELLIRAERIGDKHEVIEFKERMGDFPTPKLQAQIMLLG